VVRVGGASHREEIGRLLTRLKERDGRSYQWISQRINLSKSAVHRYCAGVSVPHDFGTIERIARACHASRADLDELYRAWSRARGSRDRAPDRAPPRPATARPAGESTATPVGFTTQRPVRYRMRRGRTLVAAALVLASTALAASDDSTASRHTVDKTVVAEPQRVAGPLWTLPAEAVPRQLFGVTMNSSTGNMPAFDVGAVRLWDSDTRWSAIQPRRGGYDWTVLDRLVDEATKAQLPVLFVAGGTPAWAAPEGALAPYADGTRTAPPADLADWDTFIRALARRYPRRIEAYELWVLANDQRMYSGTVETLVEMTRRASRIIRAEDPAATVVCPTMGNLWTVEGQRFLRRFVELGGYRECDVASVKLFQWTATDPPETMLGLTSTIGRIFDEAGLRPRLWNAGTSYSIPLQGTLDQTTARNYAVRFFLVGLYARNVRLERMYFYNWGGIKLPIVLQPDGGAPTPAAWAVERLQQWLTGAESRSCGHGPAAGLPEHGWMCEFSIDENGRRLPAVIIWTQTGTARTKARTGASEVRRLDGTTTAIGPGDLMTISEEPVLVVNRA
jgi:hypothetical protein